MLTTLNLSTIGCDALLISSSQELWHTRIIRIIHGLHTRVAGVRHWQRSWWQSRVGAKIAGESPQVTAAGKIWQRQRRQQRWWSHQGRQWLLQRLNAAGQLCMFIVCDITYTEDNWHSYKYALGETYHSWVLVTSTRYVLGYSNCASQVLPSFPMLMEQLRHLAADAACAFLIYSGDVQNCGLAISTRLQWKN